MALEAARLQRPGTPEAMEPAITLEQASALQGGATAMISQDPRRLAALPLPPHPPLR